MLASRVMLIHLESPPNDIRMNGLHIWCVPYLDDILIITFNMEDCQKKLLRAMTALKVQKTAPICPLAMGEHIPFMITDMHLKWKREIEYNRCCSNCGIDEQLLNTQPQRIVPSFNNSEPIPWDLFIKYGRVVPPPKTHSRSKARSPDARARHSQSKVNQLLNEALEKCPNKGINPVEVKILEEAVRDSLKAFYAKAGQDKKHNKRHKSH